MVIKQSQATVGGNLKVGVDGKILLLVTALENTSHNSKERSRL